MLSISTWRSHLLALEVRLKVKITFDGWMPKRLVVCVGGLVSEDDGQ